MNFITKISLKNIIAVLILCIFVLGGGYISTNSIKLQTFPNITFPVLFLQVQYFGQSAEDVEKDVVTPVEEALINQKNYEAITSTSAENFGTIIIQYPFGSDLDDLTTKTEDAIAKLDLPEKAKVTVTKLSFDSVPIYQAAISTEGDTDIQSIVEEKLLPKLDKIDGIGEVRLLGVVSQEIRIEVDQALATANGISLQSIVTALQGQDYVLSLGSVQEETGTVPVTLTNNMDTFAQLEDIELTLAAGGFGNAGGTGQMPTAPTTIRLGDLAEIVKVDKQNEISRFNGKPSLILEVTKNQEANTAELATAVKEQIAAVQETESITLNVIFDQGEEVEKSVSTLVKEGLFGALFTSLVILVFLRNFRATLIAIFSLPLSIFATIMVLNQVGYTLNIMTLGGLAVSIGRIVDDSIVVIENIYRWRSEKGNQYKGKELVFKATSEVIGAVSSSTFATVVVFLPLAFVSGVIGEFFRPFALTVVVAIVSSLIVAIAAIPVFGHIFLSKVKHVEKEGRIILWFEKFLKGALKRKALVIILSFLMLFGSFGLVPFLGISFLPSNAEPSFTMTVTMPGKTSLQETNEMSMELEKYFAEMPGVINRQVSVGGVGSDPASFGLPRTNVASITVKMQAETNIDDVMNKVTVDMNEMLKDMNSEAQINVRQAEGGGPPSGNNVTIDLFGNDQKQLAIAATQIENYFKQNDQLKNVSNNLKEVQPKWVMNINDEGKALNISAFQILGTVSPYLRATDAGSFQLDGQEWEVTLSYDKMITTEKELETIPIFTAQGIKTIGDIATITQAESPISINHQDGRSAAQVSAIIKSDNVTEVSSQVKLDIAALTFPQGVEYRIGGGSDEIIAGFIDLGLAILVAIGLVFLVLSITFGGLLTPMIILSSLIFIPVGAFAGLLIGNQTLSISAMIGILMLIGIVVTNAVVLLDRVEKNRKSGMEITESLIEASKTRMRPILMTAFATICALLPLAFSSSTSGLISKGLAVTVIGGLTTSTMLTLVFVPVLYALFGKYRKISKEQNDF